MASELQGGARGEPAGPRRLVVASGNAHKVVEIERILAGAAPGLEVRGQRDFGVPPSIEETADDFAGNARLKAEGIAAWLRDRLRDPVRDPKHGPRQGVGLDGATAVLADDSGVCVDVLDGAPGVISARFAGEPCDDAANNAKLVQELEARGCSASPGHYRCVLALVRVDGARWPGEDTACLFFDGRWDVELRVDRRGTGGFGYDPHAWLTDGRTVAELSPDDKAAVSHRGQAMRALVAWFRGLSR
ncbi:MAG: non-canonical purine NTP pyrophosphatase [Myxococcota bacterium]